MCDDLGSTTSRKGAIASDPVQTPKMNRRETFEDETNSTPISSDEFVQKMESVGVFVKQMPLKYDQILLMVKMRVAKMDRLARWRIHPEGPFMSFWDIIMLGALLFTAIVTPYEIAFIETVLWDTLFCINRTLDIIFLVDLIISFFVMYYDEDGRLISSFSLIAMRYLKRMFIVDVLSLLPYDTVKYMYEEGQLSDVTIRFIRIPRLLKLLRLSRIVKIFRRWETHFGILHKDMVIMRLASMLFGLNHWMACLWGLIPSLEAQGAYTWFTAWYESRDFIGDRPAICHFEATVANAILRGEIGECFHHTEVYVPSLHWAMMTVTSIGYGDVVPQNVFEYSICVIFMLLSGMCWAVIIGGICGIISTGDEVEKKFNLLNDDMNRFMATKSFKITTETKRHVRKYMQHSKGSMRNRAHKVIISNLSPLLAGEMSQKIPFIRNRMCIWLVKCSEGFCVSRALFESLQHHSSCNPRASHLSTTTLSMHIPLTLLTSPMHLLGFWCVLFFSQAEMVLNMHSYCYSPQERIFPEDCMYVLKKGSVCSENATPFLWISAHAKSTVWNEDVLIHQPWLKKRMICRTLA
jgi:hypothetical protein